MNESEYKTSVLWFLNQCAVLSYFFFLNFGTHKLCPILGAGCSKVVHNGVSLRGPETQVSMLVLPEFRPSSLRETKINNVFHF